jgi:hypothetical protein
MSAAGRPRALNEDNQATVCSLVAAGVSLRQAAEFVDCDARSIRRAAQRNDEFRRQLAKAKSEANIHPLQTLRQAAQTDWRAALRWMERLDPERFARPNATVVTQREANQFVSDLVESIERVISNDNERTGLFELLSAAMPAAMRRRWDGRRMRRNIEQVRRVCDLRKWEENERKRAKSEERDKRRREIFVEVARYLPLELRAKLSLNSDLLDPEEVFAQRPEASDHRTCAAAEPHHDARANGSPTNDGPTNSGLTKVGSTNDGPTNVGLTNNASPAENFAPPPGRNPENIAPPPPTNL